MQLVQIGLALAAPCDLDQPGFLQFLDELVKEALKYAVGMAVYCEGRHFAYYMRT